MGDRVGDQGRGRLDVTLRQPQQGQPRLWRPRVLVRGDERLLGSGQIAFAQPDVPELGQRPTELAPHPGTQFVARCQRLLLGPVARARDAQHLRPVHPAATVDAPDRSPVPPSLHHVGPLAGPLVEGEVLRRADQLAVHHARRELVDLTGHQQRGDLVQHLETLVDATVEDRDPSGSNTPDHHGRLHTEPSTELDRLCRPAPRRVHVAAHEPLVAADHGDDRMGRRFAVPEQ